MAALYEVRRSNTAFESRLSSPKCSLVTGVTISMFIISCIGHSCRGFQLFVAPLFSSLLICCLVTQLKPDAKHWYLCSSCHLDWNKQSHNNLNQSEMDWLGWIWFTWKLAGCYGLVTHHVANMSPVNWRNEICFTCFTQHALEQCFSTLVQDWETRIRSNGTPRPVGFKGLKKLNGQESTARETKHLYNINMFRLCCWHVAVRCCLMQ